MAQVLGSPLYICGVITGYDGRRLKFQTDTQYTRDRFGSETLMVMLYHEKQGKFARVIIGYDGYGLKFHTDMQFARDRFGSETVRVTLHHEIFNRVSLLRVIHRHTREIPDLVYHPV